MRKFGIDISRWQRGMDLAQAKAEGVEFVILRGANSCDKDSCFDSFYEQAKALGLGVGCYQYSLAVTEEQARVEAQYLIDNVLRGRQFEYPIYMDCEDADQKALEKETVDDIIRAWCNAMEAAGYFAGVYCNGDFYRNHCSGAEMSKRYTWWYAAWCADEITDYPMHQFGGGTNMVRSNTVAGHVCDQDYCYMDFPTVIRAAGKNGYAADVPQETPAAPAKTVDELASEVIAGEWGNGAERQQRLEAAGYNYVAVQGAVNAKLEPDEPQETTYNVNPGDTLWGIAQTYGTTVAALANHNDIADPGLIYAGQEIRIPD
ncbi:MAG: LysM peptidoglycan-binding domain-containing protein [Clostridiales bacterium]|nr:LysM peptidoglycan-binding domain-containing protein [Clostridiales bacterium]